MQREQHARARQDGRQIVAEEFAAHLAWIRADEIEQAKAYLRVLDFEPYDPYGDEDLYFDL